MYMHNIYFFHPLLIVFQKTSVYLYVLYLKSKCHPKRASTLPVKKGKHMFSTHFSFVFDFISDYLVLGTTGQQILDLSSQRSPTTCPGRGLRLSSTIFIITMIIQI